MYGGWYGPLVDIRDADAHVGYHVQLVVLTMECSPPLRVETRSGTQAIRSVIHVGDSTRLYFKVSLWKNHASQQLSAGDILLLQNMKIREFRGVVEATSVQHSKVSVLVKRHDVLSTQASEKALELCHDGPATKEKLKLVLEWTKSTQLVLVSFLDQIAAENGRNEGLTIDGKPCNGNKKQRIMDMEVKKCSSVNQVRGITESCLVEFSANIGDICLPLGTGFPGKPCSSLGWIFFSQFLYDKRVEGLLKELVCIGCKQCGCPLQHDHNRVYEQCSCLLEPSSLRTIEAYPRMNKGDVGWIFRPFILHVWDDSSQLPLSVKNLTAVKLFASLTAERLACSLQKHYSSILEDWSNPLGCHESLRMANDKEDLNCCSLFVLLLRCMLRRGKNSPFTFKVLWRPENQGLSLLNSSLNLVDFGLPTVIPPM